MKRYDKILVPFDFSVLSKIALAEAVSLAKTLGARVELLHVIEPASGLTPPPSPLGMVGALEPESPEVRREKLEQVVAEIPTAGVEMICRIEVGNPWECILTHADKYDADLVVMGTHGHKGAARLVFGSQAEQVMRRANVPVLVVRVDLDERDVPRRDAAASDTARHVVIMRPTSLMEAELVKGLLVDSGIAARIPGELSTDPMTTCEESMGQVQVTVPEEEAVRARKVIKAAVDAGRALEGKLAEGP